MAQTCSDQSRSSQVRVLCRKKNRLAHNNLGHAEDRLRWPLKNCSVRVAEVVNKEGTCGRAGGHNLSPRFFENRICKSGAGGDTNRTHF